MAPRRAFEFVVAVAVAAHPLAGQEVLRLAPTGNEIGLESRAEQYGADGRLTSRSIWLGEWMSLSFTGMLVSPKLLSWSATVRPYAGQQGGTDIAYGADTRNTGLSFGANLLAGFPVSASLYSHRAGGRVASATGGASDNRNATTGATIIWRNDPLPVTLSLSRRSLEDAWRADPAAPPLRREESLSSGRIEARSSKLAVVGERLDFVDRIGALDFASSSLVVDHTLRWGRGSSLASQFQTERRAGSFAFDRTGGAVRMQVRHGQPTTSSLFVDRRQGTASGVAVRQEAMGYEIRNQTREWVTTTGSASWNRSVHGPASMTMTRIGTRVEMTTQLPRGVRLAATTAGHVERVDRNLGDAAWTFVYSETHGIEATRGFELPFADIDEASIQVRSVDQTVLFVPEMDYAVVTAGATVRIQALPGGRLSAGDVVLVDYRYAAVDAGRHRVLGLSADLFLGTDWASIWATEGLRVADADASVGVASSLEGRDRTLGATVRRDVGGGRVSLDASRRSRTRSVADVSSRELHVRWLPSSSAQRRWALGARRMTSMAGGQRLASLSADATFSWNVSPDLRALAGAEYWLWKPDGTTTERFLTANGEVSWVFDRMDVIWRYIFQQRTLVASSDQHRFTLRVVRHF